MPNSISAEIEYFFHEGKENLENCVRIAFETALRRDVKTLVIFTGIGEGPKLAIEKFRPQERYADIKIVAAGGAIRVHKVIRPVYVCVGRRKER